MRALNTLILASAGLLTAVTPIRADFMATAYLNPGADNATASNGSGTLMLDYNATSDIFTYTLSWANLTGPATMAHIHLGAPGVSGPIIIPFFMSSMPATDTISGTLTQADVTPANGISTIAQVAQQIEMGDAYANIHTTQYPAGELRGQIAVSPEPATTGLMLTAMAGAAGIAWRRRRQAA